MNDLEGCEITYEQAMAELEAIEKQLAAKYNLAEPVRQTLIEKISAPDHGAFENDLLVRDWVAACHVLNWFEEGR